MALEIIQSDSLTGVQHGFFTRRGGASSGIYHGLNCGGGSSDQAEVVALNRQRAAHAMDLTAQQVAFVHQVHSATALPMAAPCPDPRPKADGMVTATPGLGLAILTADCQPVLFSDVEAGVIGAAHAGWRGALDGVLEATVEAMCELGAQRDRITAVIGPSISQKSYEVGPEFRERFCEAAAQNASFFAANDRGRYQFDLPGYGLARLRSAGVAAAAWTGHCTYSDAARFYSYRRATHKKEADYGRLLSMIRL